MRIVFMGSPEFAVPSLNALVEAGHDVVAAYCQPPRPAGRGKAERKTAVHVRAEALGIEVRTPRTLRDEEEQKRFRELEADLAVVAAYGLILPKPILEAPKQGCINVHASLLPRWRGAAPIQRAILAGDPETGITIMRMEEGLDTGPMLLKISTMIDRKNAGQLTDELARMGALGLRKWLENPASHRPRPQDDAKATYAPKIDKAEARIEFSGTADHIERQVRAFNPFPGAWFEFAGERIKVLEAQVTSGGGIPGEVADNALTVDCGTGAIQFLVLQRPGKKPMPVNEFLRGFPIRAWSVLE
jgi:methionyl-tRNA formyltransferase